MQRPVQYRLRGINLKRKAINCKDCFVAYLDILGYSESINKQQSALAYYNAIDSAISRWSKKIDREFKTRTILRNLSLEVLSDSFIVVLDYQRVIKEIKLGKHGSDILSGVFLGLIAYLIQDCIRGLNLLFRGAVVRGHYYQREFKNLRGGSFIFSQGFCQAYKFSEENADVPRILVEESFLACCHFKAWQCGEKNPAGLLLRDNDGLYYLNIYSAAISVSDADFTKKILLGIAKVIKKSLKKYYFDEIEIRRKWVWFANYHNSMIKRFSECDDPFAKKLHNSCKSLLIKISDL